VLEASVGMHQRKSSKPSSSPAAGISKPKLVPLDAVSLDISAIALRSGHGSASSLPLRHRRRNAVFSTSTDCPAQDAPESIASECIASSARILSNVACSSGPAVNIHIEALAHGVALSHDTRAVALRALQRCFLFADVSVGVISDMCDHARVMFVSANTVLQPEGSECVSAFVALDGAFSSNGSGGAASCMLACEETFVLGHMLCRSSVTLRQSSHVAIFPGHSFASCAARHARFERSLTCSAAELFGCCSQSSASRLFLQPARGAVNISGCAHERINGIAAISGCQHVCVALVYGSCVAHDAAARCVPLRAGAVIHTTMASLQSSGLAQASVRYCHTMQGVFDDAMWWLTC